MDGGLNNYAYANNNPLGYIDPYGDVPLIPIVVRGVLWWLCYKDCVRDWRLPDAPGCDTPGVGAAAKAYCAIKCALFSKTKAPKKGPSRTPKKPKKKGKEFGKNKKKKK